jgi:hypothetical protein
LRKKVLSKLEWMVNAKYCLIAKIITEDSKSFYLSLVRLIYKIIESQNLEK